jgi:hypothetical protein
MRFVLWNWPEYAHPIKNRGDTCAIVGRGRYGTDGQTLRYLARSDTPTTAAAKFQSVCDARDYPTDRPHMLFIQNLGNYRYGPNGMMSRGLQPIASPTPNTPDPAAASLFRSAAKSELTTFIQSLAPTIKSYLDSRSIAIDHYCDDREETWGADKSGTWEFAWLTGGNRGIFEPSVNATGASSELWVPGVTLSQLETARAAAGATIERNGFQYSATNKLFVQWLSGNYDQDGYDGLTIRDAMRTAFPGLTYSNYANAIGASTANPFREYWAGWNVAHAPTMFADVHSPVLYAPNMAQGFHVANKLPGETDDEYFVRFHIANRQAIADGPHSSKPVHSWFSPPSSDQGGTFVPSLEATATLIRRLYQEFGDDTFYLWTVDQNRTGGATTDTEAQRAIMYDDALAVIQAISPDGRNPARPSRQRLSLRTVLRMDAFELGEAELRRTFER